MSAIDFTLDIEKVEDPKGDRIKVTMKGKFLPYKNAIRKGVHRTPFLIALVQSVIHRDRR